MGVRKRKFIQIRFNANEKQQWQQQQRATNQFTDVHRDSGILHALNKQPDHMELLIKF